MNGKCKSEVFFGISNCFTCLRQGQGHGTYITVMGYKFAALDDLVIDLEIINHRFEQPLSFAQNNKNFDFHKKE